MEIKLDVLKSWYNYALRKHYPYINFTFENPELLSLDDCNKDYYDLCRENIVKVIELLNIDEDEIIKVYSTSETLHKFVDSKDESIELFEGVELYTGKVKKDKLLDIIDYATFPSEDKDSEEDSTEYTLPTLKDCSVRDIYHFSNLSLSLEIYDQRGGILIGDRSKLVEIFDKCNSSYRYLLNEYWYEDMIAKLSRLDGTK